MLSLLTHPLLRRAKKGGAPTLVTRLKDFGKCKYLGLVIPACNILCVAFAIVAVELILVWNNFQGVYNLGSVGQLIPFIVGLVGLLRLLLELSVERSTVNSTEVIMELLDGTVPGENVKGGDLEKKSKPGYSGTRSSNRRSWSPTEDSRHKDDLETYPLHDSCEAVFWKHRPMRRRSFHTIERGDVSHDAPDHGDDYYSEVEPRWAGHLDLRFEPEVSVECYGRKGIELHEMNNGRTIVFLKDFRDIRDPVPCEIRKGHATDSTVPYGVADITINTAYPRRSRFCCSRSVSTTKKSEVASTRSASTPPTNRMSKAWPSQGVASNTQESIGGPARSRSLSDEREITRVSSTEDKREDAYEQPRPRSRCHDHSGSFSSGSNSPGLRESRSHNNGLQRTNTDEEPSDRKCSWIRNIFKVFWAPAKKLIRLQKDHYSKRLNKKAGELKEVEKGPGIFLHHCVRKRVRAQVDWEQLRQAGESNAILTFLFEVADSLQESLLELHLLESARLMNNLPNFIIAAWDIRQRKLKGEIGMTVQHEELSAKWRSLFGDNILSTFFREAKRELERRDWKNWQLDAPEYSNRCRWSI